MHAHSLTQGNQCRAARLTRLYATSQPTWFWCVATQQNVFDGGHLCDRSYHTALRDLGDLGGTKPHVISLLVRPAMFLFAGLR